MLQKNDGIRIVKEKSFYVGDAAGRPEQKSIKRRKDHSIADRLFALNIGISFFTPEEHFLRVKQEQWIRPAFDPKLIKNVDLITPKNAKLSSSSLEVKLKYSKKKKKI